MGLLFFYMILNNKTLSRTIKKTESVGKKMVGRLGDRKHTYLGGGGANS